MCPSDYVYVKFNNCKTSFDKDLQDNYCILLSRRSSITNKASDMVTCAETRQLYETALERWNIKVNYAFCLLTLWFAMKLMLTNYDDNRQNTIKLSNSTIMLIKFLLFTLIILTIVVTLRSFIVLTKMYNCLAPAYAHDVDRILVGFYGLSVMALANKLKNYETLVVLFAVYGFSLFGMA